jgi:hypothetical protein
MSFFSLFCAKQLKFCAMLFHITKSLFCQFCCYLF